MSGRRGEAARGSQDGGRILSHFAVALFRCLYYRSDVPGERV